MIKMKYICDIILVVISFVIIVQCRAPKIPNYVQICKRDSNLDECIKESITKLKPHLVNGIRDMNLIAIEPMLIPQALYETPSLTMEFTDFRTYNLKAADIESVHMDFDNSMLSIAVTIPFTRITGMFKSTGIIGSFRINGHGLFTGNLTHIEIDLDAPFKIEKRNGKEYLKFGESTVKVNTGKYKVQLDNIVDGNEQLSAAVNDVLNESKDLIDDIARVVYQSVLSVSIKSVFDLFPFDVLIPKE